jgi:hypothetical protein
VRLCESGRAAFFDTLRAAFDTNGDGKLTDAAAEFSKFKIMVTNADGTQTSKTLAEPGITELNLNAVMALKKKKTSPFPARCPYFGDSAFYYP